MSWLWNSILAYFCLNNNRGNWIIVIIHFPWLFPDHFSIPWLFQVFQVFQKSGHPGCYSLTFVMNLFNKQCQTVNDRVAHSKNPRKCACHVTFDLDLDLKHTLDAGLPGDHRVQLWWRSGHLSARRSDLRKSLQTDGRTDGRTTDASPLY